LILANLGRDAEAKEAVVRPLVLEPDFCISEWAEYFHFNYKHLDGVRGGESGIRTHDTEFA